MIAKRFRSGDGIFFVVSFVSFDSLRLFESFTGLEGVRID
jgi:hypothetical protein